jgi:phospholipase A1
MRHRPLQIAAGFLAASFLPLTVHSQLPEATPLDARLGAIQKEARGKWFILPYRPNYLLPVTYMDDPNNQPLIDSGAPNEEFDNVEVKFQISFMLPLLEQKLPADGSLYLAYTQVSFWQAYNNDLSEPFRDTNYEPEFFLLFDTDFNVLGLRNRAISLGLVHQSNGRGTDVLTRSWNRLYANFLLDRGNFTLGFKPWLRLGDAEENPDIDTYLGYGELRGIYTYKDHGFTVMLRNNLRTSNNRGAVEAGWSFPLYRNLKGYVQYFYGYGENLLDYDYRNNRIGVGLMLSDWL